MSRFWSFLYRRLRATDTTDTFESEQPWVTYTYFVPMWISRILGRFSVRCLCCICGKDAFPTIRMPRWGPVKDVGKHPLRKRFLKEHVHPRLNEHPLSWELPLRNPEVLREGDLEEIGEVVMDRAHRAARRAELEA